MHTDRTRTTWSRRTTAASVRYAWGRWGVVPRGAGASGALVIVLLQVMLLAISGRGS